MNNMNSRSAMQHSL